MKGCLKNEDALRFPIFDQSIYQWQQNLSTFFVFVKLKRIEFKYDFFPATCLIHGPTAFIRKSKVATDNKNQIKQ